MGKVRIVKGKVLADCLVWLGFEYYKDEHNNYIFERNSSFDSAWKDLHYLRSKYDKRNNCESLTLPCRYCGGCEFKVIEQSCECDGKTIINEIKCLKCGKVYYLTNKE